MTQDQVKEAAHAKLAIHGESLESIIVADYVDESGNPATRVFQWAALIERKEFARFTSWCIKNKRTIRLTPFNLFS